MITTKLKRHHIDHKIEPPCLPDIPIALGLSARVYALCARNFKAPLVSGADVISVSRLIVAQNSKYNNIPNQI